MKKWHPSLERDLLAHANAAIEKAADTKDVRISLHDLLKKKGWLTAPAPAPLPAQPAPPTFRQSCPLRSHRRRNGCRPTNRDLRRYFRSRSRSRVRQNRVTGTGTGMGTGSEIAVRGCSSRNWLLPPPSIATYNTFEPQCIRLTIVPPRTDRGSMAGDRISFAAPGDQSRRPFRDRRPRFGTTAREPGRRPARQARGDPARPGYPPGRGAPAHRGRSGSGQDPPGQGHRPQPGLSLPSHPVHAGPAAQRPDRHQRLPPAFRRVRLQARARCSVRSSWPTRSTGPRREPKAPCWRP